MTLLRSYSSGLDDLRTNASAIPIGRQRHKVQRSAHVKEDGLQLFRLCLLLPMFVAPALAADAENGKRLAEARCVTCHMWHRVRAGRSPTPRRLT